MRRDWPPTEWDEADFYRDELTRLPTRLYPFAIRADENGSWSVWKLKGDGDGRMLSRHSDIFAAFLSMGEQYREWFPTRPVERVYFIGTELRRGADLKVGYSLNPEGRLRQLQTSHPEKLQIFVTVEGGKDLEERYHRRWRSRRRHGEWFTIGDCIIDEINRLKNTEAFARREVVA